MPTELFQKGLAVRRELVGDEAVDKSFTEAGDYGRPMQEFVTEYCWGAVWTREALDRRSRSLLNIGMLAAANRPEELAGHIRVGIKNGLTKDEIRECFLQVSIYLGMPAGLSGFRIAEKVFDELSL
jgi:4-carboxymuconolactone decarboxylase